jgi:hypothetical protein
MDHSHRLPKWINDVERKLAVTNLFQPRWSLSLKGTVYTVHFGWFNRVDQRGGPVSTLLKISTDSRPFPSEPGPQLRPRQASLWTTLPAAMLQQLPQKLIEILLFRKQEVSFKSCSLRGDRAQRNFLGHTAASGYDFPTFRELTTSPSSGCAGGLILPRLHR